MGTVSKVGFAYSSIVVKYLTNQLMTVTNLLSSVDLLLEFFTVAKRVVHVMIVNACQALILT